MKSKHILLASLLLLLFGCSMSEDIKEADKFMETFFNQRIKEGGTGAREFYSQEFFNATPESDWKNIQTLVLKANGELLSYEQLDWRLNNSASTSELSGTFVIYQYKTTYEKGEGTETVRLFKNSDNPGFKIISHNYNSALIQDLINKGIEQAAETE